MANAAVSKFTATQGSKTLAYASIFVGLISLVVGFQMDHTPEKSVIWQGYLTAFFFFTSLALGGLFFAALQHVTKAGWSTSIRRLAESLASFLPVAAIMAIPLIVFGAPKLYHWLHADVVAQDALLMKKSSYLNPGFFYVRTALFFGLWLVFGKLIIGNSLKQDESGDERLTHKNVPLSIAFILIFALSYSLFSVDFLMSLDAHWFSTIFGVYTFSGMFQSSMAFLIILTVWLKRRGLLTGFVDENHLHDLGKLMFAFTVFYAYIAFSQFMLIWYANLPEETIFFAHRAHGGWFVVSMSLLILKFAVPFLSLLPRAAKRDEVTLVMVALLILAMQYIDNVWLVYPNFSHENFSFPFVGVGIFVGFLGIFLLCVSRFLTKNNIVALKDPRLHEATHHHI